MTAINDDNDDRNVAAADCEEGDDASEAFIGGEKDGKAGGERDATIDALRSSSIPSLRQRGSSGGSQRPPAATLARSASDSMMTTSTFVPFESTSSVRPGVMRRNSSIAHDVIHETMRRHAVLPAYITEALEDEDKAEEINVAEEARRASLHVAASHDDVEGAGEDGFDENARGSSGRKENGCAICCAGQVEKMKTTADWWSLWIGLASFAIAIALVFLVPYDISSSRAKYVIPRPMRWETNPFDAWDWYAFAGTILLLSYFCSLYLLAMLCMGKFAKNSPRKHATGIFWMGTIATMSLWVGSKRWCSLNGLSYAIWSLLAGMIITISPLGNWGALRSLKITSKDGEFFIKCSLTLLATEFSILAEVGLP